MSAVDDSNTTTQKGTTPVSEIEILILIDYVKLIVCILAMLSPNLAVFLSLAYSFTVNLALLFFKILDTISKQEDKLSAKSSQ